MITAFTPQASNHKGLGPLASRVVQANAMEWEPIKYPGCYVKTLMVDPKTGLLTVLLKMDPGASLPDHEHALMEQTYVIDFDDCGWGWWLYDFGAAVSFFEHDPRVPELLQAWLRGYRTVLPVPATDEAEIPTFVLMRRLLLLAWIGSHAGTDLARSMGASYTTASCDLAEGYLARFG